MGERSSGFSGVDPPKDVPRAPLVAEHSNTRLGTAVRRLEFVKTRQFVFCLEERSLKMSCTKITKQRSTKILLGLVRVPGFYLPTGRSRYVATKVSRYLYLDLTNQLVVFRVFTSTLISLHFDILHRRAFARNQDSLRIQTTSRGLI